jgi:hypothetical protein
VLVVLQQHTITISVANTMHPVAFGTLMKDLWQNRAKIAVSNLEITKASLAKERAQRVLEILPQLRLL